MSSRAREGGRIIGRLCAFEGAFFGRTCCEFAAIFQTADSHSTTRPAAQQTSPESVGIPAPASNLARLLLLSRQRWTRTQAASHRFRSGLAHVRCYQHRPCPSTLSALDPPPCPGAGGVAWLPAGAPVSRNEFFTAALLGILHVVEHGDEVFQAFQQQVPALASLSPLHCLQVIKSVILMVPFRPSSKVRYSSSVSFWVTKWTSPSAIFVQMPSCCRLSILSLTLMSSGIARASESTSLRIAPESNKPTSNVPLPACGSFSMFSCCMECSLSGCNMHHATFTEYEGADPCAIPVRANLSRKISGFDRHTRTRQARLDDSPIFGFRRSHSDNPGEA